MKQVFFFFLRLNGFRPPAICQRVYGRRGRNLTTFREIDEAFA